MLMTFTVRARVDVDPRVAHLGSERLAGSVGEGLRLALGAGEAIGFTHKLEDFLAVEILDVIPGHQAEDGG